MNSLQNDENSNHNPSTTTQIISPTISTSTTMHSLSTSLEQNPKQHLINSFLDSAQVIKLFHDYLHEWSELNRRQIANSEAVEKIQKHLTNKTIPNQMQIKLQINLPQECKEFQSTINNTILESNLKILELILDARQWYLAKLNEQLKSFITITKSSFISYVDTHSQSITSLPISFPSEEIVSQFIEKLQYKIAEKLSNTIHLQQEEKRKKEKQKEEEALAEEKVKTNKEKTIGALIEIGIEKKLKKKRHHEQLILNTINKNEINSNTHQFKKQKKKFNKSIKKNNNINNNNNNNINNNINNNNNNYNNNNNNKRNNNSYSRKSGTNSSNRNYNNNTINYNAPQVPTTTSFNHSKNFNSGKQNSNTTNSSTFRQPTHRPLHVVKKQRS